MANENPKMMALLLTLGAVEASQAALNQALIRCELPGSYFDDGTAVNGSIAEKLHEISAMIGQVRRALAKESGI